jgi:hypothetical protein
VTEDLKAAYERALKEFRGKPGVSGIDIGYEWQDGISTGNICVRVHVVDQELPIIVPDRIGAVCVIRLPAIYGLQPGLSSVRSAVSPRGKYLEPVQPGIAVARIGMRPGTLGALVFDSAGRKAILGAAHVLAGGGNPKRGDHVFQPTAQKADRNYVGFLQTWIRNELGDAALVIFDASSRDFVPQQYESNVVVNSARRAQLGETVEKSGLGTDVTCGLVDGIGQYELSAMWMEGFRIVPPKDRLPISENYDSGSLWYAQSSTAGIGLHVGGDDKAGRWAIACHLTEVLRTLGASLTNTAESRVAC